MEFESKVIVSWGLQCCGLFSLIGVYEFGKGAHEAVDWGSSDDVICLILEVGGDGFNWLSMELICFWACFNWPLRSAHYFVIFNFNSDKFQLNLETFLLLEPGLHLDFFCLLLLVLVFRTNKKPQRATWNAMLRWKHSQKKAKRATKSIDLLVFEIELKGNERQMETPTKNQLNEQQRAAKGIFRSHFHSFAPILDLWKVVDIKSNEKPERATGNEKQWKAAKSYEEQQKATTDIGAGKTKTGKKKQRRATKGTKSPNGNQALINSSLNSFIWFFALLWHRVPCLYDFHFLL